MNLSKRKLIKYLISIGAVSSLGAYGYFKARPISIQSRNKPKIAIVGLGSFGIAVTNYLRRFVDNLDITVIDNHKNYRDRFSQSLDLVRGLSTNRVQSKEKMLQLDYHANSNFRWYQDNVIAINPSTNRIQTQNNGIIDYDALVLAPGVSNIDNELTTLQSEKVGSFYYDYQKNSQTLTRIKELLKNDRMISFFYPANPTASRAHFFENVLMANLFKTYYQSGNVEVITAENSFHPILKYDQTLDSILKDLNHINYQKNTQIASLNLETNRIVFRSANSTLQGNFDYFCYVPEVKVADFLGGDLLMDSRFIPVNPNTLQHQKFQNIFALGDAADLNVEKSLLSISEQVSVLTKNLIAFLNDKPLLENYNGYSVFSVMSSKNIGYYWEYNNLGIIDNNFYTIKVGRYPTRQQKIALTTYSQAKYKMALMGLLL